MVQLAGIASLTNPQIQERVAVWNAIWEQACIQFELLDADIIRDPKIVQGGTTRKPPKTAIPSDAASGTVGNFSEYIDFLKVAGTKINVFFVQGIQEPPGEEGEFAGVTNAGGSFFVLDNGKLPNVVRISGAHELGHVLGSLGEAYPVRGDSAQEKARKIRENHDMLMYSTGQTAHRLPVADALTCRRDSRLR